ncbi:MAG: TIGR00282 family metallophosphoesterase [Bacilli bacterium]|nr:TIGR00282 family metallophosphoesterase [Bacilli bacterium]
MRILFYGDVVGEVGRNAVHFSLPHLVEKYGVDFVIVNGENATHGRGLNEKHYNFLVDSGADCITLGNHWHDTRDFDDYVDDAEILVRPLNLLDYEQGQGSIAFDINGVEVRVTNILGVAFMKETVISPYQSMEELLHSEDYEPCIHIVDFHADSTSEKAIFANYFDGRVSAVLGTHTHVQTNDSRILEHGTGFMTDVGCCGDHGGIIGYDRDSTVNIMVKGVNAHFSINESAKMFIDAVIMDFDDLTHKCTNIFHISQEVSK